MLFNTALESANYKNITPLSFECSEDKGWLKFFGRLFYKKCVYANVINVISGGNVHTEWETCKTDAVIDIEV